jgi:hypothetical protein
MTASLITALLASFAVACTPESGGGGDGQDSGVVQNSDSGSDADDARSNSDADPSSDADPNSDADSGDTGPNNDADSDIDAHTGPREYTGLDILWVIDNSGSMCEEQAALRNNFPQFISEISTHDIDFHLGVTTTQMEPFALEPVAQAGHLQSTPQPLPSFIPTCHGDAGASSDPVDGYRPIREAIDVAVGCTKDPAQWASLSDATDDYIECQLQPGLTSCSCNDDPNDNDVCDPQNLFPGVEGQTSPYRDIPKVLRSSDYEDATGQLQLARIEADFACMSMVGTRGNPVEKGLAAAARAVSPDMTGGTVENPTDTSAPNHGLLRENAKFSAIFVTDENDCSHDGTLPEDTPCGDDICAFANHPDVQDSPLISSADMATLVKDNLSDSKGYTVTNDAVVAASIHGNAKRYGATSDYPQGDPQDYEACKDLQQPPSDSVEEQTSCNSQFGSAFSGDRYERFLRQFDASQVFPTVPGDPNAHMDGLICEPAQFGDTLEGIGTMLAGSLDP